MGIQFPLSTELVGANLFLGQIFEKTGNFSKDTQPFLVEKPLRHKKHIPVLLFGWSFRYTIFPELNNNFKKFHSDVFRNQRKGDIVPYLDPLHFTQQLLSMEASCIDTKNFFDQDLQRHLSILTRDYPEDNYEDLFQFAYSLLPFCSTNFQFYEKAWLKLLRVRDKKRPCVIVPRDEFDGTDKQHEGKSTYWNPPPRNETIRGIKEWSQNLPYKLVGAEFSGVQL